jgi:hypothetical protein
MCTKCDFANNVAEELHMAFNGVFNGEHVVSKAVQSCRAVTGIVMIHPAQ